MNGVIKSIDENDVQIRLNIEGANNKFCFESNDGLKYAKFGKVRDIMAEVVASNILETIGVDTAHYDFLRSYKGGNSRAGTVSDDYSKGYDYRITLADMLEKVGGLNSANTISHIYASVPTAVSAVTKFCNSKKAIHYSRSKENEIHDKLAIMSIVDYFICNGDHHTKNTEFLIKNNKDNSSSIDLSPVFDLGNSFRSADTRLALTLDDFENSSKQSLTETYANGIVDYFNASNGDLQDNPAFEAMCKLLDVNIESIIYSTMLRAVGKYDYKGQVFSKDNFEELLSGILPEFNEKLGAELDMNVLYEIVESYNERRQCLLDKVLDNEKLHDSYMQLTTVADNCVEQSLE